VRNLLKLVLFVGRRTDGGRSTRLALAAIVVTGFLSGAASSGFIALINATLHRSASRSVLLPLFVLACLLLPALRFTSTVLLTRLTQQAQFELRLALARRILAAPLLELERIGPARLLAVVTEDIGTITGALSNLPLVLLHLTVVIGCLLYLGWLSPVLLLVVVVFVVVGVATYRLPLWKAQHRFRQVRQAWDSLYQQMRGLTDGSKELKVHRRRREAFLEQVLAPAARSLWHHMVRGSAITAAANSWGQVLFFVLIGLLLFGLPTAGDGEVLTGYTLAILYMITPLDTLLNLLPTFARAAVAADKVESLGLRLEGAREPVEAAAAPRRPWRRLELVAVTHTFRTETAEEEFMLGPLDLVFEPGEIVFIVGGNGSGKTTFAKVLLGLYLPQSGEIRLDGEAVGSQTRDGYRQLFAAVFADSYLFDRLLGLDSPNLDARARDALRWLQLDRKVTVGNGVFSTLDLSQGQRKRLALLTALLEERPIYVFDEWAADQDPGFKRVFYRELLPELRTKGRTLFVISHDDAYYDAADRIVKLDYGRVVFDGPADIYLIEHPEAGLGGAASRAIPPAGS
jgi:putative pyoverdin transport system ATP-binding/permease protein